jgi:hypothetical protein
VKESDGALNVIAGRELMVKLTGPLVKPDCVTVTLAEPVALPAIVNVAAIWVELTTTKLLTVMPALPGLTTAPAVKFIPARLTCTVEPAAPLLGLIEVSVGATTIWEIAKVAFTDAEVAPEALNVIVHVY